MNKHRFMATVESVDPYQILFPLGLAHAFYGASLWILFVFQLVPYPGLLHAHHMIDGFLFTFAAGFLLTAIPRFTGAARCSALELLLGALLSILSFVDSRSLAAFAMLIFLSVFFARRFKGRTFSPPPHFLFLPIGLFLGLTGSILLSLVQFQLINPGFSLAGRTFLYYGTMLAFLLGVGAKLISALLGWSKPPTHRIEPVQNVNDPQKKDSNKWKIPVIQAVLFLLSFALELLVHPSLGRSLRALCATWIGIQNWQLFQRPKAKGKLAFWIWIAAWALITGLWVHALFPSLDVHAAHLIFISGFGLMTILVASRVTLAHGGYSLDLESQSRVYGVTCSLILLAALTRFVAQWTPSFFTHLAYAAGTWLFALTIWTLFFLPKIIFHSTNIFSFKTLWSKRRPCFCGKKVKEYEDGI